jgi:hypothetical protein
MTFKITIVSKFNNHFKNHINFKITQREKKKMLNVSNFLLRDKYQDDPKLIH